MLKLIKKLFRLRKKLPEGVEEIVHIGQVKCPELYNENGAQEPRIDCAYCNKVMKPGAGDVSHGICAECLEVQQKLIEEYKQKHGDKRPDETQPEEEKNDSSNN